MNNEMPPNLGLNQHLGSYVFPVQSLGDYPDQQLGVYPRQELGKEQEQQG